MKKLLMGLWITALLFGCSKAEEPVPQETEPAQTETVSEEGGTLVIWFSCTGEQYRVGVIEEGNTAIIAGMIMDETGADGFEIIPEEEYPVTYDELTDVARKEQNDQARPAYKGELPDLDGYSTIFVGAPVWWGDWPMIMYTVFENNDFSGKRLIPFSTHEGSGLSGFDRKLADAVPDAQIGEGLAVQGSEAQNDRTQVLEDVRTWLNTLGY